MMMLRKDLIRSATITIRVSGFMSPSWSSTVSAAVAPYDETRDASDARKFTMQRILTEESEDTVEEYLRQKYAMGPTSRYSAL